MADQISLADWLNDQLSEKKMSHTELARKAGISRSVITKITQRMVIKPDPTTYTAIAKALDVSPITVFRIAGILPPDPDFPELEDIKTALLQLSPERRKECLVLIKALVNYERKLKSSPSQE